MRVNRRDVLACLPAACLPGAASAFRPEPPAASVAADYGNACDAQATHEALQAELERLFDGRPIPPGIEPRMEAVSRCPFCGCGVLGRADHGEDRESRDRPG